MADEDSASIERALSACGYIANNATFADLCMQTIFHNLVGCHDTVSQAIYFTLDSVNGRASLVRRVAEALLAAGSTLQGLDADLVAKIGELGEAVKKTSNHRNGFAHSIVYLRNDFLAREAHVVMSRPKQVSGVPEKLTPDAIKAAEAASRQHLLNTTKVFEEICQKLGIRPQVALGRS